MQEIESPAYYAIIPANIRYDKDLIPSAKLLYGEITALSNKNGYCWAKNKYFSDLYGVTKKTISTWINQLKEKGFISIEITYKHKSREIKDRKITIDPINEKVNTPITKKLIPHNEKVIDNNINTNNTSSNTISKDIDSSTLESTAKLYDKYSSILEAWNSIEQTTTHSKKAIKLLIQLDKYIKALKNGKFGSIVDLKKDSIDKNNIPNSLISKKWSEEEIIEVIKLHSKAFLEGYLPSNKKYLPKNINDFIFNRRSGCSFLLKWKESSPKKDIGIIKCKDSEIYDMYAEEFSNLITSDRSKKQLTLLVNDLIYEFKDIWENIGKYLATQSSFSSYCGTLKNYKAFFKNHIKFLIDNCGEKLVLGWIGVGNKVWDNYITSIQKKDRNIVIYPEFKQRKKIIKKHLNIKREQSKKKYMEMRDNAIEMLDDIDDVIIQEKLIKHQKKVKESQFMTL